jgi:hypothetical protein
MLPAMPLHLLLMGITSFTPERPYRMFTGVTIPDATVLVKREIELPFQILKSQMERKGMNKWYRGATTRSTSIPLVSVRPISIERRRNVVQQADRLESSQHTANYGETNVGVGVSVGVSVPVVVGVSGLSGSRLLLISDGISNVWPTCIASASIKPLAAINSSTVVPNSAARLLSVSPFCTTYRPAGVGVGTSCRA